MRIFDVVLVTAATALLATGALTYPEVPGVALLAMAIVGVALVVPVGARSRTPVGVK